MATRAVGSHGRHVRERGVLRLIRRTHDGLDHHVRVDQFHDMPFEAGEGCAPSSCAHAAWSPPQSRAGGRGRPHGGFAAGRWSDPARGLASGRGVTWRSRPASAARRRASPGRRPTPAAIHFRQQPCLGLGRRVLPIDVPRGFEAGRVKEGHASRANNVVARHPERVRRARHDRRQRAAQQAKVD